MTRPRGGQGLPDRVHRIEGLEAPPCVVHCDSHGIQPAILAGTDSLGLMSRGALERAPVKGVLEEIPIDRALPLPLLTMAFYDRAHGPPGAATRDFTAAPTAEAREVLRLV